MPRKYAAPIWPSEAIHLAYQRDLRLQVIKPMADDLLRDLRAAWRDDIGVVGDSPDQPRDAQGRWTHTAEIDVHVAELGPDDPEEQFTETSHHESEANARAHVEKVRARIARRLDNGRHTVRAVRIKPYASDRMGADARPPTSKLRIVMERWGKKWTARLETLAEKMAREFATASKTYTDNAMKASFKAAGLTIQWRPTKRMLEGYAAVVYENVQLIKSIPAKFLTDVQSDVWLSVTKGADMAALTEKIKQSYGVTWRRAALISRDQTAKAKGVFEAARRDDLGIKKAKWLHSAAGREPRPTHVAMNGKLFDVTKGMYDKDEGEWIQPGELINCRCTSAAVIPGFD